MKKWIGIAMSLLVGASVFGQGSAPAPAQLWRYKTNKDTLVLRLNSGDTLKVYDTAGYTILRTRGANVWMRVPDSVRMKYLLVDGQARVNSGYFTAVQGIIIGDPLNIADTINTLGGTQSGLGSGISILNGQLTANLGDTIDDTTEVKRFMLNGRYLNPSSDFIFTHIYKRPGGNFAGDTTLLNNGNAALIPDSEYVTQGYVDNHINSKLFGNDPVTTGHVPVYDATNNRVYWQAQSGGGGGGVGIRIDSTSGGTDTASWIPSTLFLRPDSQVTFSKGAAADTLILGLNGRIFKQSSTATTGRDTLHLEGSTATDHFLTVTNSGTTTIISASGGNDALRFGKPTTIDGNLTLSTASSYGIYNPTTIIGNLNDGGAMLSIADTSGIDLGGSGGPVTFGGAPSWEIRADTIKKRTNTGGLIRGINTKIDSMLSVDVDTVRVDVGTRMYHDTTKWFSDPTSGNQQVVRQWRRDTSNAVTIDTTPGILRLVADPGYTWIDTLRVNKYMVVKDTAGNKRTLDSALAVGADTIRAQVGVAIKGATSGAVTFKSRAVAGSTVYTFPPDSTNGLVLSTNGAGTLSWVTGGGGSGNGSANFDTASNANGSDTGTLIGSSGASIFKVKQVGVNRTALTAGANTTLELGLNSGVPVVDSSLRITNGLDFGGGFDTTARLDSITVATLRRMRDAVRFYPAQGVYGRPKAPNGSSPLIDSVYLTAPHWMDSASGVLWAWTDSSLKGTDTDYVYQTITFGDSALIDSLHFLYITGTSAVLDTIKIYKQLSGTGGTWTISDTLKATIGVAGTSTSRARVVAAVNGATGWAVSRGEIWTIKFRNKFPSANGVVRVFGLAARGRVRP